MAGVGAAESILEAELSCPVCLSTYREPVTLSCGHCFCKQCITEVLSHQKEQGRSYTCPMCQQHYQDFPVLLKNLQLSSIVENYVSMQKKTEDCQIACGDCLDHPNMAVKTCVTCEVSLCYKHLDRHVRKSHILLEPTACVEERRCSEHDKLLEYHCDQDNCCICVTCYIAGSHKGHHIMTLKQAHENKLATLSTTISALSASVSEFCNDIKDLHASLAKITENTVKLSKPLDDLCDRIVLLVKGQFKEIAQAISSNQAQATSQITAMIKQIEEAKATDEQALKELNLISQQPDDLLFIKDFTRLHALISQSARIDTMQVIDVEADKIMVENVDKETSDYIVRISRHLEYMHNVLAQQIEQLAWSGTERQKVQNEKKVLQIRWQKSEKMNLMFTNFNNSHCSYTFTVSNLRKTLSVMKIPAFGQVRQPAGFVTPTLNQRRLYSNASPSTPPCNCKLPVIISAGGTSSSKVHCLVDVTMSSDWCVGVTINTSNSRYLQWRGNRLSYESDTSLSLGSSQINRLKMQLDFHTNLLGFYDASCDTEMPILICKCDYLFTRSVAVGFNILDGSLTLI